VKISTPDYDLWNRSAPVKDLLRDMPVVEELFFDDPDLLDYTPVREAWEETGDDGICEGIVGNTFFEFLTLHREGGAVQVILDLHDHAGYLGSLRDRYAAYLAEVAERICERTSVEGLFLNCGSSTLTVVSPDLFREWDLPVVRAVAAAAGRRGRIFHYHLHGKGRRLLDMLVDAGVTMLCPVEGPPRGDFLLGEVKGRFGARLALKGGFDPFLLREASDREIEALVLRCLGEAAPRGGYTLATGDGVLKDTPFDRIRLLVELGRRHGGY
jgi:uroporphyrinogen-III decarboxylase